MYVLVNHSDDYGLSHCGTFETHKEAYEYISDDVAWNFNFKLDLMSMYPFNNQDDCLVYDENYGEVWAGYNWCNWYYESGYGEKWLIIEV